MWKRKEEESGEGRGKITRKWSRAILINFCNPEIPRLGRHQTQDSGLAKTAEIP